MRDKSNQPVWTPTPEIIDRANVTSAAREMGWPDYAALWRWSVTDREAFWDFTIRRLNIQFRLPPSRVLKPNSTSDAPTWLPGASLNIVDSCLQSAGEAPAIIWGRVNGERIEYSYSALGRLVNRVSNGASIWRGAAA